MGRGGFLEIFLFFMRKWGFFLGEVDIRIGRFEFLFYYLRDVFVI